MNLEQLISLDIAGKNVLVVGFAGAGKTHISDLLCYDGSHELIHTDDLLNVGYTGSQAVESLLEDIEDYKRRCKPIIIEGVLCYLLLVRGYKPDLIIHVQISAGKQRLVYLRERNTAKMKWLKGFNEMCLVSYNKYLNVWPERERPPIIEFKNEYELHDNRTTHESN